MASASRTAGDDRRPPVRVLLADDQPLLRTGFRTVLRAAPDLHLVAEAADGAEALSLAKRLTPDVLLMAARLPRLDATATTRAIVQAGLPVRVVVLTLTDLDECGDAALRAGASGVLVNDLPADHLLSAIRTVAGGATVVPPPVLRRLLAPGAAATPATDTAGHATGPAGPVWDARRLLTERECEVLVQVAHGLTNGEIAQLLSVSETTVKTHVGRVLTKLGLRDRVQAAVWAYNSGLVRPHR